MIQSIDLLLDGLDGGRPPRSLCRDVLDRLGEELVTVDPLSLGVCALDVARANDRAGELRLAKVVTEPERHLLVRMGDAEHRAADLWTDSNEVRLSKLTAFLTKACCREGIEVCRISRGGGGEPLLVCLTGAQRERLAPFGLGLVGPGETGPGDLLPADHGL
jgi:hypothetical protein